MTNDGIRTRVGVTGLERVDRGVCELFEPYGEIVGWGEQSGELYPTSAREQCDFTVVCIDTPLGDDGRAEIRSVTQAVHALPCARVLLKSTVPPGTTARLPDSIGRPICFWPEYVGESALASDRRFRTALEAVDGDRTDL
jgi:UDPglucose 6-dehydrogenase